MFLETNEYLERYLESKPALWALLRKSQNRKQQTEIFYCVARRNTTRREKTKLQTATVFNL